MRFCKAYSRQGALTGQSAQIRRATSTPTPSFGKNVEGGISRHFPCAIHTVSITPPSSYRERAQVAEGSQEPASPKRRPRMSGEVPPQETSMDDSQDARTEENPRWPEPPEPDEPATAPVPPPATEYGYGQFSDPTERQQAWGAPVWPPPTPPTDEPSTATVTGSAPAEAGRRGPAVWLVALVAALVGALVGGGVAVATRGTKTRTVSQASLPRSSSSPAPPVVTGNQIRDLLDRVEPA